MENIPFGGTPAINAMALTYAIDKKSGVAVELGNRLALYDAGLVSSVWSSDALDSQVEE